MPSRFRGLMFAAMSVALMLTSQGAPAHAADSPDKSNAKANAKTDGHDCSADTAFVYLGKNVDAVITVLEHGSKLRARPSHDAVEIGRLSAGTKLQVLERIDNFNAATGDHYVWAKIKCDGAKHASCDPARHLSALEPTMTKNEHRCNCIADDTPLSLFSIDDGAQAILECSGCGASWPLLGDRLSYLDFGPLGGPLVAFVLPHSHPPSRAV